MVEEVAGINGQDERQRRQQGVPNNRPPVFLTPKQNEEEHNQDWSENDHRILGEHGDAHDRANSQGTLPGRAAQVEINGINAKEKSESRRNVRLNNASMRERRGLEREKKKSQERGAISE